MRRLPGIISVCGLFLIAAGIAFAQSYQKVCMEIHPACGIWTCFPAAYSCPGGGVGNCFSVEYKEGGRCREVYTSASDCTENWYLCERDVHDGDSFCSTGSYNTQTLLCTTTFSAWFCIP
jgi:hypothetical protein